MGPMAQTVADKTPLMTQIVLGPQAWGLRMEKEGGKLHKA